jgi:hypothetical protein
MSTLDVRKKVSSERLAGTHERLRADHIQMMEMLQRTQDSNAKLELELETLRAQLGDSAAKPIDDELSAEVLKSEVVALRDKVKELELANLCLGRMHEGTIEVGHVPHVQRLHVWNTINVCRRLSQCNYRTSKIIARLSRASMTT